MKNLYYQLILNVTSKEEVATVATVVDLLNLTELMCVKQMIGMKFKSPCSAYYLILKVRGDVDFLSFNKTMNDLPEVRGVGMYRNADQMVRLTKEFCEFFRV